MRTPASHDEASASESDRVRVQWALRGAAPGADRARRVGLSDRRSWACYGEAARHAARAVEACPTLALLLDADVRT